MEGRRPALLHAGHLSGGEPEGTTSWEPSISWLSTSGGQDRKGEK